MATPAKEKEKEPEKKAKGKDEVIGADGKPVTPTVEYGGDGITPKAEFDEQQKKLREKEEG